MNRNVPGNTVHPEVHRHSSAAPAVAALIADLVIEQGLRPVPVEGGRTRRGEAPIA